jgi:hypothetical protein
MTWRHAIAMRARAFHYLERKASCAHQVTMTGSAHYQPAFSSFFKEEIIYHGHWPQHDHLLEISELITGSQLYCMHLYIYICIHLMQVLDFQH